jgi:chromatin remodeling complex protein RSC6
VAAAAAPAAAAAAPAKKAAAKKAAAPAPAATPAPAAPAPAPETAAAPAAEQVEEVRLEAEAKALTARLLTIRETVSELISEAKRLEKKAAKVQKLADKRRRKAPKVAGEGKPSVFEIPTNISPALCSFLGRPAGSQESRSNVSRLISEYIKAHNLKVEKSHDINADAKLRNLLGLKEGDKLTYFNLQKYLNPHYLKAQPTA